MGSADLGITKSSAVRWRSGVRSVVRIFGCVRTGEESWGSSAISSWSDDAFGARDEELRLIDSRRRIAESWWSKYWMAGVLVLLMSKASGLTSSSSPESESIFALWLMSISAWLASKQWAKNSRFRIVTSAKVPEVASRWRRIRREDFRSSIIVALSSCRP